MTKWYGPGRTGHYATVLAAGRRRQPRARQDLLKLAGDPLYPVIVRATALDLLNRYPGPDTAQAIEQAATDPEALIRRTAANQSDLLPPARRARLLKALVYDPVAAVRMEAASQMTTVADIELDIDQQRVFQSALQEYKKAMYYSADFAFGRFNLGNLYVNLRQSEAAMAHYRAAIRIDDQFYMAKVNLAVLASQKGDNAEAERLLRQALAVREDLYEVHYSLGLLLAEENRYREAVDHLETAVKGMPDFARAYYNLGQILDFLEEGQKAQTALEKAYMLEPDITKHLKALAQHYLRHRKFFEARRLAESLLAGDPDNQLAKELLRLARKK